MQPRFTHTILAVAILATSALAHTTANADSRSHSGQEQLQRLLKPHFFPIPVTRAARAAAGNPDMVVLDRRGRPGEVYRCSFITLRGKRAMVCD